MVIRLLTATETTEAIVAYLFILVTPLSLVPALAVWQALGLGALVVIAALSGFGVIGHLCTTRAFAVTETTIVMPFDYVRTPMFAIIGLVFFGEVPEPWTLASSAVIIGSVLYIGQREAALARAGR